MEQYQQLVQDVLVDGNYKPNRTRSDTISSFSHTATYDLSTFPLLTTKDMSGFRLNSMLHEIEWYLSGEEHIRTLREETGIWDEWADEDGNLDTAYGRFWRRYPLPEAKQQLPGESWADEDVPWVSYEQETDTHVIDQIEYVKHCLQNKPNTRRMVITAWHPANATVSTLPPCHFTYVLNVQGNTLNCHLTQRSGDIALGVPFNIATYALLTKLFTKGTDLKPGTFSHTIVDAHVYCGQHEEQGQWYGENIDELQERLTADPLSDTISWINNESPNPDDDEDHVVGLLEQCTRDPYDPPSVSLDCNSITDFSADCVSVEKYESHDGIYFGVTE